MPANRLGRRGFLMAILAGMTTNSLMNSPVVADAIEQYPEDRVAVAVRLARSACSLDQVIKRDGNQHILRKMQEFDASISALFRHILESFRSDNLDRTTAWVILNKPERLGLTGDMLNEEELSLLVEGAIPLVIARSILFVHRLPVRAKHVPEMKEFSERYVSVVLFPDDSKYKRFDEMSVLRTWNLIARHRLAGRPVHLLTRGAAPVDWEIGIQGIPELSPDAGIVSEFAFSDPIADNYVTVIPSDQGVVSG